MFQSRERETIDRIHREALDLGKYGKKFAAGLNRDISTAFEGGNKFVYELLQNAVDAADPQNTKGLNISFELITIGSHQYLLFSHDGIHFTDNDVVRITDYATQEDDFKKSKSGVENKIGYKGIGFKAVFTIASCVTIFSRGYQFRFDGNYSTWQTNTYPWQVIPIWTELNFIPQVLQSTMQNGHVNFLIQIKPTIQLSEALDFIIQQPTMLVFLKNLTSLRIKKSERDIVLFELSRTVLGDSEMLNINCTNRRVSGTQWLIRRYPDLEIAETLRTTLRSMDRHACPDRLRNATHTSVTFAAELINHKLMPRKNATLYCYLPTQIIAGLPYLVNADFLLNTERAHIVDNTWNVALFHFIATEQFTWIAELAAQSQYRHSALNLLSQSNIYGVPQQCVSSFQEGYKKAVSTVAFIPAKKTQELLKVADALWDTTGFYQEFSELDPVSAQTRLLDERIENGAILRKLSLKLFSYNDLSSALSDYMGWRKNQTIVFQMKILDFLFRRKDEPLLFAILKNMPFLLSEKSYPTIPSQLYYPIQQDIPTLTGCPKPLFIDLQVLTEVQKFPLKFSWLVTLGLNPASNDGLMLDYILKLIQEAKVTRTNVLAITRYLVKYLLDKITDDQWKILSMLPVLTKADELVKSHELYLSDCFSPNPVLERKLPPSIFVSAQYVELSSESAEYQYEIQRWARFFKAIGVNSDLRIHFRSMTIEQARRILPSFVQYEASIQQELRRVIQPTDTINRMPHFSMIKYITSHPIINRLFIQQFVKQWEEIESAQPIQYQRFRSYYPLTNSYIAFLFRHSPCLQASDKNYYQSSKLFSARFKGVAKVNPSILFFRKGILLSDHQEKYLGLITALSFQDCFNALVSPKKSIEIFPIIYRELLSIIKTLDDIQKEQLKNADIDFPNQTNDLVRREDLRCFAIEGQNTPINSVTWLKHFPEFNQHEMVLLATLFGITIVNDLSENLSFTDKVKDDETKAFLYTKISDSYWSRIEIICYFEAQCQVKSFYEIRDTIFGLLNVLSLYKVSKLYSSDIPLKAFLKEQDLFYKSDWRKHQASDFFHCLGQYLELSPESVQRLGELLHHKKPGKLIKKWRLPENPDNLPLMNDDNITDDDDSSWEDLVVDMSLSMIEEPKRDVSLNHSETPKTSKLSLFSANKSKHSGRSISKSPVSVSDRSFSLVDPADIDFTDLEIYNGDLLVQSRKVSKKLFKVSEHMGLESQSLEGDTETQLQESAIGVQSPAASPADEVRKEPTFQEDLQKNNTQVGYAKKLTIDKDMIGRWGEKLIYFRYLRKYSKAPYHCQITDTPDGFKAIGRKESSDQPVNVLVIWHNMNMNKNENRDITVLKGEKEKVVEVKATTGNKCTFHWSKNELELAREKTRLYTLFHVSNVGRGKPVIRKIIDPATQLTENKLQIISQKCQFEMDDALTVSKK